MKTFPKGVRVVVDPISPYESAVFDIENGKPVDNVTAVKISLDARGERPENSIEVTLSFIPVEVTGEAVYRVDEETLRRLANDNGFDLVARG